MPKMFSILIHDSSWWELIKLVVVLLYVVGFNYYASNLNTLKERKISKENKPNQELYILYGRQ